MNSLHVVFWTVLSMGMAIVSFYLLFKFKRKQIAEKQLDLMSKETLVLYDHAPCGYHSVDGDGCVINMNKTLLQWLGYEKDEILGKVKFTEIIDGEAKDVNEKLGAMMKAGRGKIEIGLIRKSGERLPVVLGIMPAGPLTPDKSKFLFSSIDNTRCHEAFDKIKMLDQELEAFSYSISHDLRAPLRSIDGYSRILQEDYAEKLDEEGRRVLNVVMNNARRMGKLIDDLLDFGRLGRKPIQRTYVSMEALVTNIAQDLKMQEPARHFSIRTGELLPASADAEMMRQVWFNLLENAFKFTGKKDFSDIDISSFKINDSEICYMVKDNGVGFDMRYAEKLFGVFQRLHKMQDFSGTGVGLAIVKRIISRHGGRVWAEASLNEGAAFYFTLPVENEGR